ncbi:MAG: metallopeptidase TldD-related protein [Acidimicrobiales bacterium]|nr:metallopeptidase TldD-related protein [Acidimicrobiales bacterium]
MTTVLDATAGVEVADRTVKAALAAGADGAQVVHVFDELFEVTYDNNDINMIRTTVDDQVSMTVYVNGAKGQASLTGRSNDLVEQAAAEAVASAKAGLADPANALVEGEPTSLVEVGDREPQQEAILDAITRHQAFVREHFPQITLREPTVQFHNRWRSFVNSVGLQHQERRGSYATSSMFSARQGAHQTSFNYTGASSVDLFDELHNAATVTRLMSDTVASFDPKPVPETFVGDVIFTPDSVGTLLNAVLQSLTGYVLMRGTSPFQNAIGQTIADSRLTITNRPRSPQFPLAASFDGDGVESCDLPVVTNGVLDHHLIDWYTSRKLGRPMTCGVTALDVAPGDQSFDELVAGTERGIILGRFSGGMPNQQLDFSGVAKNSFYVEKGKVQFPISETMIAGNFAELLNSIRAIGSESINYGGYAFPAIATTGVTISTK